MQKQLEKVTNFMIQSDQDVLSLPKIPTEDICKLRANIMQEEVNEMYKAIYDNDIVEVADALADQLVILLGSVNSFGLRECFSEIFDEVCRTNDAKICIGREAMEKTLRFWREQGVECFQVETEANVFVIKRASDKKILKPEGWQPPNIKAIIERYR